MWKSLLVWGASVCHNPPLSPVYLWTAGTVGQFVLSVHCVKFVLVLSPVALSLRTEMSSSSVECASEAVTNARSVTSRWFRKVTSCSHTAKCTSMLLSTPNPSPSDSVIQASTVPALLQAIAQSGTD